MCENCDSSKSFMKGIVFGAAAGAILGILFAPESGEKTRKRIKSESVKLKYKGLEALEDAKDKIQEAECKLDELRKEAEPMIENAIEDVEDTGEGIKESIVETAERIGEKAKTLKNKYFRGTK
jgi:gas vesicle protein